MRPLISVITPTWLRHDLLLTRCMASVQDQTYPNVEHIIVSDGPDPDLKQALSRLMRRRFAPKIRYAELDEHEPTDHWGAACRNRALELARGELVTYIDDDDRLFPKHCELLAAPLLADPELDWAYSEMHSHGVVADIVLAGPPAEGLIGTPMIMHRRALTDWLGWGKGSRIEDWELVKSWLDAGTKFVGIGEVTVEVWPSAGR